jgi:hypothetical protein
MCNPKNYLLLTRVPNVSRCPSAIPLETSLPLATSVGMSIGRAKWLPASMKKSAGS